MVLIMGGLAATFFLLRTLSYRIFLRKLIVGLGLKLMAEPKARWYVIDVYSGSEKSV